MKIVKRILLILLVLILGGGIAGFFYFKNKFMGARPNTLTVSNLGQPFDFMWQGQEINGDYESKVAMYVPVTIPGVDRTFYMQFDTGAPTTVLYYNSVVSINEKYGEIFQLDSLSETWHVNNASIKVGTVAVEASEMYFKGRSAPIDWSAANEIIKIGTVGSDFMEKNVLIMDYKKEQITLAASVPDTLDARASYLPFTFEGRKVFLSAQLDNEPADLWFDSGSSAFELIVEEDTFEQLARPGAKRSTYTGNSWGQGVTIHNIASDGTFDFGTTTVPLTYVTYMEWPNKLQALMMKAANIGGDLGGMTGNKLFIGKTLVLDTPNLRYALIP